jgi:hypothetical protein
LNSSRIKNGVLLRADTIWSDNLNLKRDAIPGAGDLTCDGRRAWSRNAGSGERATGVHTDACAEES